MRKINLVLLILAFLAFSHTTMAATVKQIDSYGIYLKEKGGYSKLAPLEHWDLFYRHFKQIPTAKSTDTPLQLVIYQKDLKTDRLAFELHPLDVLPRRIPLKHNLSPVAGKKDMYKVTFDKAASKDHVLYAMTANERGLILLSDPRKKLYEIYSDKNQATAGAIDSIEDILKAYPNDDKFKVLLTRWKKQEILDRDHDAYRNVTDYWQRYKKSQKPKSKIHWLEQAKTQINRYLKAYPQGLHATEAKKLLADIDKKLNI